MSPVGRWKRSGGFGVIPLYGPVFGTTMTGTVTSPDRLNWKLVVMNTDCAVLVSVAEP